MSQRTRILLLIPHLGGGGAERVAAQLAQHLDPKRFDVHLGIITPDRAETPPPPSWVTVHRIGVSRVRQAAFRLPTLIRGIRPDIVLSSMAHLNFLVLLLKPFVPRGTRILVRQNTTTSAANSTWLAQLPYRLLYRCADQVICQSQSMADDLAHNFGIPPEKLAVLLNPTNMPSNGRHSDTSHDPLWSADEWPRLLSIGRLSREKGLDLLLTAAVAIRRRHSQLQLVILGAGPEEAALKNLASVLDLEEHVRFAGYAAEPGIYFRGATLFVLPSRYEGMPNALLEAAAAGLPIVATPCCSGVSRLLGNAPGTWLTSAVTSDALSDTILDALATLDHATDEPVRFEHAFVAPYETSTAIDGYEHLLLRVARRSTR
jgi:glycosyltransferase involved in cell wall biosynthesis